MKIFCFSLSCSVLLTSGLVVAAPVKPVAKVPAKPVKSVAKPAVKPTPIPSKYDQLPFNMSRQSVPKGYLGHDVAQLYKALNARVKLQGKDEDLLVYFRRMDAYVNDPKPLWGKVKFDSTFALVQNVELTYDAANSKGKLEFRIAMTPRDLMTGSYKDQGMLEFNSTMLSQSLYKNAQKEDVLKGVFNAYDVMLRGWLKMPVPPTSLGPLGRLEAEMKPEHVKMAGKDLKLLVLYTLRGPYHSKVTQRNPPDAGILLDTTTTHQVIHGDIKEIWLYHGKTGELWMRYWPRKESEGETQ